MSGSGTRKAGSVGFADQMSDAEALMWNVEKDPWLASTIGTLILTDRPIDPVRLRRRLTHAVATIARMRARVAPRLGRLQAPGWQTDPEFELDHHLRHVALPAPGDRATLLDVACRLIEDPFDRTRPLWQFVVIDGLDGGGGALLIKLHHSVTDGIGAIHLAAQYMDVDAQGTDPPDVDLDAVIAADLAAAGSGGDAPSEASPHDRTAASLGVAATAAVTGVGHAARVPFTLARRWAGDAMAAMADPSRLPEWGGTVVQQVRRTVSQLDPNGAGARSALWAQRSRRRRLRVLDLDLSAMKTAATAHGASLNDLFVAGAALAAGRYHEAVGLPLDEVTLTFVVSTRNGADVAGNSFSPVKATVPTGRGVELDVHLRAVHDVLALRRAEVSGGTGLLEVLAGAVNMLPTSVVTRVARSQAMSVDFATSNVRAAPFPVYVGGARVQATYPVGPLAGTACNLTMMSYDGHLHLGLHLDPVAVRDPDLFVRCLEDAYAALVNTAGRATCDR